jgi:hypothetical protein
MHFDRGQIAAGQRVAQSEAGVGECAGVDNQAKNFGVSVFTDLVDNEALVVTLIKLHFYAERFGLFG